MKDVDDNTQTISPADKEGDGLQCAPGQDVVVVLPANNYVWTITLDKDESTYTYV